MKKGLRSGMNDLANWDSVYVDSHNMAVEWSRGKIGGIRQRVCPVLGTFDGPAPQRDAPGEDSIGARVTRDMVTQVSFSK